MSKREKLKAITHSWVGRTRNTGTVAALTAGYAASKLFRSSEEADARFGEGLLDRLDEMKGFAMKVGQILSYVDGALPAAAQERLRALQQGQRTLEAPAVRAQVEAALGAPVDTLFERFDDDPLAAASIGQVHRARFEGREVAVKVQYPHVADTFRTDFRQLRGVAALAGLGTAVDGQALVAELEARFLEECDYQREASWQEAFQDALADLPGAFVPGVARARSAPTVLTTDFVEGAPFYRFLETASQEAKDRAGLLLFEVSFRCIFRHGAIQADPHPGNFLFPADGRVALLDWGCVRAYERPFVERWRALARVLLDHDRSAFEEAFRATGMVGSPRFDFDAQYLQMRHLYAPLDTASYQFTPDYVAATMELAKPGNPNLRRLAMPPEWLWTNRLHFGLYSVLAALGARGDFRAAYERALAAPWQPVRPLGAAQAAAAAPG
jgi:predicted unusual protein kinase regulating ubiquinone biosynthesis (AarF/ABC1/UbiB family)